MTETGNKPTIGGRLWDIADIAHELRAARDDWRAAHRVPGPRGEIGFPSKVRLEEIVKALCGALFPLRLGPNSVRPDNEEAFVAETLETALVDLHAQIHLEISYQRVELDSEALKREAARIISGFASSLPRLRRLLDRDVEAAYAGDPAARSVDEVLLCYPGVLAVIHQRLAHRLYELGAPIVARIISEIAHAETGIDIHPGARIGESFFIDHGSGVVIGETVIIGDRVRLYQAVTLGARSFPADDNGTLTKGLERHPIVEDDVVIYAGATILGRVTIGRGAVIGGNVWLTESVSAGSVIHQANAERETADTAQLPSGHINLAAAEI